MGKWSTYRRRGGGTRFLGVLPLPDGNWFIRQVGADIQAEVTRSKLPGESGWQVARHQGEGGDLIVGPVFTVRSVWAVVFTGLAAGYWNFYIRSVGPAPEYAPVNDWSVPKTFLVT
jgi:hypothetical protein